jgi:hypothetical protein
VAQEEEEEADQEAAHTVEVAVNIALIQLSDMRQYCSVGTYMFADLFQSALRFVSDGIHMVSLYVSSDDPTL